MSWDNKAPTERVSIHAPHTGSDIIIGMSASSTIDVSIHAPHTGSDFFTVVTDSE